MTAKTSRIRCLKFHHIFSKHLLFPHIYRLFATLPHTNILIHDRPTFAIIPKRLTPVINPTDFEPSNTGRSPSSAAKCKGAAPRSESTWFKSACEACVSRRSRDEISFSVFLALMDLGWRFFACCFYNQKTDWWFGDEHKSQKANSGFFFLRYQLTYSRSTWNKFFLMFHVHQFWVFCSWSISIWRWCILAFQTANHDSFLLESSGSMEKMFWRFKVVLVEVGCFLFLQPDLLLFGQTSWEMDVCRFNVDFEWFVFLF